MTTSHAQTVLLDALCDLSALVALPLLWLSALLGAFVAALGLLWHCRRYIACAVAAVAAVAACWACPALPLGLAIVAGYAVATYPRAVAA